MYRHDPTISSIVDLYSDMPWSNFDLVGLEDQSIRSVYEGMMSELSIVPKLQQFTKDFLLTGEFIPHMLFDTKKGYWNRVIAHNPDYIRAQGVGLIMEQPLLWLRPTPEIKSLLSSPDPRVKKLQKLLPPEVVSAFRANREVPLDPLNTTLIARLPTSQSIRGESILTRVYGITMYEDFILNASLAVAQRNAAPLRIFKLGDPDSKWLPTQEDEAALAEMLSVAEQDPLAAIITHNNLTVDLVGVSDRVLLISREWEFIERVKMLALGVSKAFLVGEASFASSSAGLQTLMERLAALRYKFEQQWLITKVCKPIAQMHKFIKRTQAELDHRIRIQRSDEEEYVVPQFKWRKCLEATQETALIQIWQQLQEKGIVSKRTLASGAGIDLDDERQNLEEEKEFDMQNMPQPTPGALPGGPVAPEGPAMAPPPTTEPAAKHLNRNPYAPNTEDVIASVHELADSENRIHVNDVEELLRNSADDLSAALDKADKDVGVPLANKSILVGE
jgi:hypothetical protein